MAIIQVHPATKAGLRGKITATRRNKAIFGGVVSDEAQARDTLWTVTPDRREAA